MYVNTSRVGRLVKSQKNNRFGKKAPGIKVSMYLAILWNANLYQSICMQLITPQDGQFNSINILPYNAHNSYRVITLCYYSHLTVSNKTCFFWTIFLAITIKPVHNNLRWILSNPQSAGRISDHLRHWVFPYWLKSPWSIKKDNYWQTDDCLLMFWGHW